MARTSHLHWGLRKWMRGKSMGMLASPLFTQKRDACAAPAGIYHSSRANSVSRSSHTPVTGKLVAMYSHKRKSRRDPKKFCLLSSLLCAPRCHAFLFMFMALFVFALLEPVRWALPSMAGTQHSFATLLLAITLGSIGEVTSKFDAPA